MSRGWGLAVVGAIAVALVMANGANTDKVTTQTVSDVAPVQAPAAPVEPAGITTYADDPERGARLCDELVRLHPGLACHVEPAVNSPHGTPWWLGNDGTSWSVG